MSLASLNTKETADQGIAIAILNPKTNLPLGITIVVLGTDSDAFRSVTRKQRNRRLTTMNRNPGKGALQTDEESEAEALETLTACTKSWRTDAIPASGDAEAIPARPEIEVNDGEWLDCTPENAKRLYKDPGFTWLRLQVDREIGDRTNFLKA